MHKRTLWDWILELFVCSFLDHKWEQLTGTGMGSEENPNFQCQRCSRVRKWKEIIGV